ncbi:hypothetical protein T11_10345 [Trichinella zimbabwensis]|uniref:Uncharacterized protein n=1 Tax=Trichinella zimbabwensis TaxID=268475 RepID=A0A0V1GB85_9BILA|nr:hypothetical protein T11_10345 [Trichinella zimbabwensis]
MRICRDIAKNGLYLHFIDIYKEISNYASKLK